MLQVFLADAKDGNTEGMQQLLSLDLLYKDPNYSIADARDNEGYCPTQTLPIFHFLAAFPTFPLIPTFLTLPDQEQR